MNNALIYGPKYDQIKNEIENKEGRWGILWLKQEVGRGLTIEGYKKLTGENYSSIIPDYKPDSLRQPIQTV